MPKNEFRYSEMSQKMRQRVKKGMYAPYFEYVNRRIKDHIIQKIEHFGILHDQVRFHCGGCKCFIGITGKLMLSAVRRIVNTHRGNVCGAVRVMHTIESIQPEVRFFIGAHNKVYASTAAVMPDQLACITTVCGLVNFEMEGFIDRLRDSTDAERAKYDAEDMFDTYMSDNDFLFDKDANLLD